MQYLGASPPFLFIQFELYYGFLLIATTCTCIVYDTSCWVACVICKMIKNKYVKCPCISMQRSSWHVCGCSKIVGSFLDLVSNFGGWRCLYSMKILMSTVYQVKTFYPIFIFLTSFPQRNMWNIFFTFSMYPFLVNEWEWSCNVHSFKELEKSYM